MLDAQLPRACQSGSVSSHREPVANPSQLQIHSKSPPPRSTRSPTLTAAKLGRLHFSSAFACNCPLPPLQTEVVRAQRFQAFRAVLHPQPCYRSTMHMAQTRHHLVFCTPSEIFTKHGWNVLNSSHVTRAAPVRSYSLVHASLHPLLPCFHLA